MELTSENFKEILQDPVQSLHLAALIINKQLKDSNGGRLKYVLSNKAGEPIFALIGLTEQEDIDAASLLFSEENDDSEELSQEDFLKALDEAETIQSISFTVKLDQNEE
jgi:hypothetical protein